MSDDLVNQLTLNFLISKNQLQKLNKRLKDDTEQHRKTDKEIYGERIKELFSDLLVNKIPSDLLIDVKTSFDCFVDKCVYYFKVHDNNEVLEQERNANVDIHDDIDFEKEERAIELGNYKERDNSYNSDNSDNSDSTTNSGDDDNVDPIDYTNIIDSKQEQVTPKKVAQSGFSNDSTVSPRYYKKKQGAAETQQLPLDWFQSVRQNYKQNHIIPRTKDVIINGHNSPFREEKKKNLNKVYENY
jgi:hypothetical protein